MSTVTDPASGVGYGMGFYERRERVVDAFFDLADAIITVRSLIRQAWTLYRGIPDRHADHDQHINPRDLLAAT